jgi:HSP20 family protein
VNRLFSDFFGPENRWGIGRTRAFPALNVWEDGDNLYVEAELPGVKSESLDVTVVGDELTIKGERSAISEDGVTYHRRERGTGSFTRVVRLPVDVDANQVDASLANGVLLIKLPKSEAAKPRKVQVKAAK